MTAKKIILVVMCLMLLATVIMTSVVADRVAPMLHALGRPSQLPNQSTESSAGGELGTDSTETQDTTTQVTEPDHTHVYDRFVREAKVTCMLNGYKVYACECGRESYKDEVKATGHEWDDGVTREATCTEDGGKLYTCGKCSETELRNKVKAKGHSFGQWEADPEDPAKEIRICENCDETEIRDVEDPSIPTEGSEPTEGNDPTEDPTDSTEEPTEEPTTDENTGSGSDVGSGET